MNHTNMALTTPLRAVFLRAACILSLLGCVAAPAWELDSVRRQTLDEALRSAVTAGEVPGVVVVVTTRDSILYQGAFGVLDPEARRSMEPNAIFYIASMTKPITSVAAMMLVDEGKIALDDPAWRYLPELKGREVLVSVDSVRGAVATRPASREITIRDLLRHTSGLAYSFSNKELLAVEHYTRIAKREAPLVHDPGARWTYGMGPAQIGWIIENVTGIALEEFFKLRIFGPLAMKETSFSLPAARASRLMTLSYRYGNQLMTKPRPPSISAAGRGDGGLYSTAEDYARFMQMMLGGGAWRGTRLVSEASIAEMTHNQLGSLTVVEQPGAKPDLSAAFPLGAGRDRFGLGFQIAVDAPDGRLNGTLSWAGLYNTHFWIDTQTGIGVLFLTQVLPFYDPQVINLLRAVERTLYHSANAR